MLDYKGLHNSWSCITGGYMRLLEIIHIHVTGQYACIYQKLGTHTAFQKYVSTLKYLHFIHYRLGKVRCERI
jgi:hypothetical protein